MIEIDIQSIVVLLALAKDILSWGWNTFQSWRNPEPEPVDEIELFLIDSLQAHGLYLSLLQEGNKASRDKLEGMLEREMDRLVLRLNMSGYPVVRKDDTSGEAEDED